MCLSQPISVAHGGPLIDHSPFLKPEVVSIPPKPWGPRATEVWFCPKEKWSANIRRRNNRCWKAEQPRRPPQTPTMCRALQAEGIWWWTRQTFSQTLRSSHLGEIFKKSKLTNVLKITNCDHFYERQTKYSERRWHWNWDTKGEKEQLDSHRREVKLDSYFSP